MQKRLDEFRRTLDRTIAMAWAEEEYFPALAKGAVSLAESAQAVGKAGSQILAEGQNENGGQLEAYLLHFEWAEQAKNFLILWRDVLFQGQKAALLHLDGQVGEEALARLKARSLKTVQAAADELHPYFEKRLDEIRSAPKGEKKHLETWKLQTDPWPTYSEQIDQLAAQCTELAKQNEPLTGTSTTLRNLRSIIEEAVVFCQNEVESFKATAKQTEAFVDEHTADAGRVAKHLEELETGLKMTSYAGSFTHALDEKIAELPEKIQVPTSLSGGMVQHREINLRRRTRQWLESEILPLLYEVWELTERTGNSLKMSLVNIRNRAILLAQNEATTAIRNLDLAQPLHAFLKNTEANEAQFLELKALVSSRLSDGFCLSAVFEPKEFLPVPLQSTIEQMRLDQSPLLVKLQGWLQKINARLRQVRTDVVRENVLSQSEKIVRYVQQRTPDADNSHYSNIFLTKGYIGESFVVGREDELAHVRSIVGNWRLGFRGAVILSGQRFAGKSLFGELVANRHFIGHTIRLSPNSTLQLNGRRMETGSDLGEALSFIEKNTLGERQLIWLDDLETWSDTSTPLGQNVRLLCRSIDSLSDRLFFLVSMSSWVRRHLDRFHDLSQTFQAEVNLDRMSAAEIRQAILIRHGATHSTLVDADGKEVSPQQFQKMTNQIFKTTRGNIGDALNRWSAATRRIDEEKVMHEPGTNNALPDFLRPDSTLLLRTLLLEKRTNEYRLRRIFGPAFKTKYGGILQRLLRTGLLTRQMDGWLEVNETGANEVGRMVFGE